jgi:hypothetical protein
MVRIVDHGTWQLEATDELLRLAGASRTAVPQSGGGQ